MRIETCIFIFLIQLICFAHSAPSETTELTAFIDDLSKLARVSNAIGLEAESLKKRVPTRPVLFEVLRVDGNLLPKIKTLDTDEAVQFVQEIREKFVEDPLTNSNITLYVNALKNVLDATVKSLDEFEQLKNHKSMSSEEFYTKVKSDRHLQGKLNVSVSSKTVTLFRGIKECMEATYPRDEELALVANVSSFGNSPYLESDSLTYRMTDFANLLSTFETTMAHSNRNADVAEELHSGRRSLNKTKQIFDKIKALFAKRQHFITDAGKSSTVTLDTVYDVFRKTVIAREQEHGYRTTLSAGFRSMEDFGKIEGDLKSKWFRRKVIKNNKTDPAKLLEALQPVMTIGKMVVDLGKNWKSTLSQFSEVRLDIKKLLEVLRVITDPSDFVRDSGKLEKSIHSLETCLPKIVKPEYDDTIADNYQAARDAPDDLFRSLKVVVPALTVMNNQTTWDSFEQGFNEISNPRTPADSTVKKLHAFVDDFKTKPYYEGFMAVVTAIVDVSDHPQRIQQSLSKIKNFTGPHVSFDNYLTQSGILEFMQCLKDDNFERNNLTKSLKYFGVLSQIPMSAELMAIEDVFRVIKKTRDDVLKFLNNIPKLKMSESSRKMIADFKNSLEVSQGLGRGLNALLEMKKVIVAEDMLMATAVLTDPVKQLRSNLTGPQFNWLYDTERKFRTMLDQLRILEPLAKRLRNVSVTMMMEMFDRAYHIPGVIVQPSEMAFFAEILRAAKLDKEADKIYNLTQFNLDFSSFVSDLALAAISLRSLEEEFDIMFGTKKRETLNDDYSHERVEQSEPPLSNLSFAFICAGVLVLLFFSAFVAFGFTETGQTEYSLIWLYLFGTKKAYNKRYRYAAFMDSVANMQQVVCETTREMNPVTLRIALEKGAYVDAYSPFGNTSLHFATREGLVEIVELLIRFGADRTLLNIRNRTPEQMLPQEKTKSKSATSGSKGTTTKEEKQQEDFEKIKAIYNKYRKRKFRRTPPHKFRVIDFHIYAATSTEPKLADKFNETYPSITLTEMNEKIVTHLVVPAVDGALVAGDPWTILFVMRGVIIVKEEWMTACLEKPKLLAHDELFLVKDIEYNNVVYKDVIIPWTEAVAKRTMPFLQGIQIAFIMESCPYFDDFEAIGESHGATVWDEMPPKSRYNPGSHGYYHSDKRCFWIVYDGTKDVSTYKDDPDEIYQLMTETQLFDILIRRDKSHRITAVDPLPVLVEMNL